MSYAITLTTNDGKQLNFNCEPEQNIQEAAESAGYFLPAACKVGSCGSCFARCNTGDYHLDSYSPTLLSEKGKEHGDVLLCRTYPHSDLSIHLPYNENQIRSSEALPRDAEIIAIEKIAERTVRLVLQLLPDYQEGLAFEFEPGQFVELELIKPPIKRAYSLVNTANWDGTLEFLIRLLPQGQFSDYLQTKAKIGHFVQIHGPAGTFTLQDKGLNPRCFVAGGTGIAPFLSMLRRMAEWGESHPTHLFFGVTNEQELFFQEELTRLQQKIPQLQVEICVWQASDNWTGFKGTPAEALAAHLAKVTILPDIFLCGPPLLVDAATQIAMAAGIEESQIFCERFA